MNLDLFPYAAFDRDLLHIAFPAAAAAFVHPSAGEWIVAAWRWIRQRVRK